MSTSAWGVDHGDVISKADKKKRDYAKTAVLGGAGTMLGASAVQATGAIKEARGYRARDKALASNPATRLKKVRAADKAITTGRALGNYGQAAFLTGAGLAVAGHAGHEIANRRKKK